MHFFLSVNLPYFFSLNFHFIFWIDSMKFMIWISFHLLVFLIHVVWVANLEATIVSRQFPKAITFVDLKQMKCQFSLQQRWVYLRSPGNFNLGVCNHGNLSASSPHGKGKITLLYRGKGSREDYSKLSPWLFLDWILIRKEEESFFFLFSSTIFKGHESPPLQTSSTV